MTDAIALAAGAASFCVGATMQAEAGTAVELVAHDPGRECRHPDIARSPHCVRAEGANQFFGGEFERRGETHTEMIRSENEQSQALFRN